jgi:hypothetical protein
MTAAHSRMFETRDDREPLTEIGQRDEILRQLVTRSGLLRNERVAVDAERQADEQQAPWLFPRLRRMSDAAQRFEPRKTESDA